MERARQGPNAFLRFNYNQFIPKSPNLGQEGSEGKINVLKFRVSPRQCERQLHFTSRLRVSILKDVSRIHNNLYDFAINMISGPGTGKMIIAQPPDCVSGGVAQKSHIPTASDANGKHVGPTMGWRLETGLERC